MTGRPAAVLAVLALAGCGSSDERSPRDVVEAAQDAIAEVESYHVEGEQRDSEGRTAISGEVGPEGAHLRLQRADGDHADLISLDDGSYIRGSNGFWEESAGAKADIVELLANRWVRVPPSADTDALTDELAPATLAKCLGESLGTLSLRGTEVVAGREADVVTDAGDEPGTAPGVLYVATEEPRLPLRFRQTGPRRPGGEAISPECAEEDDGTPTTAQDLTLSRFDEDFDIEAPPDALDLEEVLGGAQGRSDA